MKRASTTNHKAGMISRNEPLASDASIHSSGGSEGNHLFMSTDSPDSPIGTSVLSLFEFFKITLIFEEKGKKRAAKREKRNIADEIQ